MSEPERLVIDHSMSLEGADALDVLSDWSQAEQAIVWDRRAGTAQLRARGIKTNELADRLASLAADVRWHTQGDDRGREVPIFLNRHDLAALIATEARDIWPSRPGLRDALRQAWRRLEERA